MCGRYTLTVSNRPDLLKVGLQTVDRFNIAPQTAVLVLDQTHEYRMMPWDYSPSWAREPMHLINARSETLREKPSFRGARRCAFLADGWYEWHREGQRKQPWYHHMRGELMYFAGIYNAETGAAIVTREAHQHIAHIHHRQPVLLEPRAVSHWLEGHDLFASAITRNVECHPVSTAVNSPEHDGFALIHPAPALPKEQPDGGRNSGDLFD